MRHAASLRLETAATHGSAFAASKSALSIHSYVDMGGVGPPSAKNRFFRLPRPQQTRGTHILSNRPSRAITCRVRVYRVRRHAGLWPTAEECASAAHSTALSRTTCHGAASAAAFPPIGSPPVRHVAAQQALQQLSWRRPRCSTKKVATSSLPRVLKVQLFSSIDHPPPCTIQVQQIVTNRISTARALQAQCESCGG